MCGLTGFWSLPAPDIEKIASQMAAAITHRGPDDSGVWSDNTHGVVLAHCRLSILDLSAAGHQPMTSPCQRYVLVFNGEIYNHRELRVKLESEGGHFNWRGHSDTEVLLAAIRHWGIRGTLEQLNGMFAFAVWDKHNRTLTLARDRLGEKPLYYGRSGNSFLFGSELKALKRHPQWNTQIDRNVLSLFLRYNYVPSPWSIYQDIFKLPPAHFVTIRDSGKLVGEPECYWSLADKIQHSSEITTHEPDVLIDELDELIRDAVGMRMMADVPLGAFLSGGIDSTLIAAQMQAQSQRPVKTFTIGFHEDGFNEATHAKAVARHLGTDHTELYVSPEETLAVIPQLPIIYDEPFSDSSQIPTFLVSKLARSQVTVSLSGDGGDELFCGYNRYVQGYQVWRKLRGLPVPARKILAGLLTHMPVTALERIQSCFPTKMRASNLADRLPKLAEVLEHHDGQAFYQSLVSHWKNPDSIVIGGHEPNTLLDQNSMPSTIDDLREKMMYWDIMTYLPDDILTKVDRASMVVSLEARVPFLDHRLVEFAWKIPLQYKYREGQGKWLLRKVLDKYVPRDLMDRPKMGFGVPIEHWLRGPLRDWAEDLLQETRLREQGFFQPEPIRRMWIEHLSGKRRSHYQLWDVLMFQAWLDVK